MTNDKNRNMQVVLRVRPLNRRELEQNQRSIIRVADSNTIIFDPDEDEDEFFFHGAKQTHRDITKRVNKKLTMLFDQVFDDASSNVDVFEHSMRPLVSSVMRGYNCSAFVYGATGAGKTHTMLGTEENPGITYLTMRELFEQIESHSEERKFDIGISYLEVYNEQVMNLLTKTGPLRLREDASGVMISGLQLKPIYNADELLSLLALGNRNRTQHPTDANAESSRSHAIFQVHIRMTNKATGQKRTVKLSMIDLAGSERGSSTKCVGQRFKEGASINKSLLALGNCINKLADGSKHIPYRDSNMTRILKDSLGGNCQTVMIANISPSSLTYEDTYNTLKYASRAQKIRTSSLTQNVFKTNLPKEFYVHKLTDTMAEVEHLQARIKILESQAATRNGDVDDGGRIAFDELIEGVTQWQQKIDRIYTELMTAQESYFNLYSKEKVLNLRTKLKGQTEQIKKMFNMNGDHLPKDLSRVEASIGKFAKQIETCRIEKERWLKRFKDAKIELLQLNKEINDERMKVMLDPYLKCKQTELGKAATECRSEHYCKIIRIYSAEMEISTKAVHLGAEIIQDAYYLMSANHLLTIETENKMKQLAKVHDGQRGVRFTNGCDDAHTKHDNDDDDMAQDLNIDDITLETGLDLMNAEGDDAIFTIPLPPTANPRAKRTLNIDNEGISLPKRFASTVLNATQVLETHSDDEENIRGVRPLVVVGRPPIKPTSTATRRPMLSSRALKETNVNVNKDCPAAKPTIKALVNGRTVTLKEKENKRFLTVVGKSPRRNSPSATSKMLNRLKTKPSSTDAMLKRLKGNPILTKPLGK